MTKTKMTGAKAVIESLYCENVDVIFGYPGGSVLPLYDELYDAKLRHVLVYIRNRMKTSVKWPTYAKIINGLCWAGPFLLISVFHSLYPYLILIGIGIGNISTYLLLRIYSKNDNKEQLLVGFLSMCMVPTLLLFSTTIFSNRPDIVLILSRLLIGVSYGLGGIYAIFTK